ncbi:MAG TPA: DNA alkylation repair protein [Trueperaceae bacterium]|nr:DNA alkylation repair protein [Trueperaceae bacterium]
MPGKVRATDRAASRRIADAAAELDAALRAEGTPERAEQEKRYLKSALEHYGVTVPANRRVVLAFLQGGAGAGIAARELPALVETLWERGVFDLRFAAVELLTARAQELSVADLTWLEPLLRRSHTWALIDGLAVDVIAPILDGAPQAAPALRAGWARDEDFWLRRVALLTLLRSLRAGNDAAFAAFAALAEPLLPEREFFIRKAIGWCLREYGKQRPDALTAWLLPRAARASGLTVREAVRHLDAEQREALLSAHGLGRGARKAR